MKKLLSFLFLTATLGSGNALAHDTCVTSASSPPEKEIVLATEEQVLPLKEVAHMMNKEVLTAATKANLQNVIVRVDFVGKENHERYSVRLPPKAWADNRLWPARACGNKMECLKEFGRLNKLPRGWKTVPISRGDAYFPLTGNGKMPRVSGSVPHATRLTSVLVPVSVAKVSAPKKGTSAVVLTPKTTKRNDASAQRGGKTRKVTPEAKNKAENAIKRPVVVPKAKETPVEHAGPALMATKKEQVPQPRPEKKEVHVRYELVCGSGWGDRTCLNRVAVTRSAPKPKERTATTKPVRSSVASKPASSLEEMIARLGNGKSSREVIVGVRGGCMNGVCHATFNGNTTAITSNVGNAIIAQKHMFSAQPAVVARK